MNITTTTTAAQTTYVSSNNTERTLLGVSTGQQEDDDNNERQHCGNNNEGNNNAVNDHRDVSQSSPIIVGTTATDNNNHEELTSLQYCRQCHVLCEDPEVCPCRLITRNNHNHATNTTKNQQPWENRSFFCFTTSLFVILLYVLISGISFIVLLRLSSVVETTWTIHNKGEIQRIDHNVGGNNNFNIQNGSSKSTSSSNCRRQNWMNNQNIRIFSTNSNNKHGGLDVFQVPPTEDDGSNGCPVKTQYKEFFSQEFLQLRDYQGEERVFPINLMANTTLDVWLRVLVGSVTVQIRDHGKEDDDQGSSSTAAGVVFFESVTHHDQINQFSFQAPKTDTYDLVYIYNQPYSVVNTAIARKEFKQTYILPKDWKPTCASTGSNNNIGGDKDCVLLNNIGKGCILVKALDDQVEIHIQCLRSWKFILVVSFLMIPSIIIIAFLIIIIVVWMDRNKKWKLLSDLPLAKPMEVYAYLHQNQNHHNRYNGCGGRGSSTSNNTDIVSTTTTTTISSSSFSHFQHEELMPLVVECNPSYRSSSTSLAYSGSYNSFTIVLPEECISVET